MADGSRLTMLLDLLRALGGQGEATFVVRNADAVTESAGPRRVSVGDGWATLERDGCSCHIHLRVDQMAEARFVQEPGLGPGTTAYSVQFFRVAGERPVLSVYLPADPYYDLLERFNWQERIAFQPGPGGA
jgi:putative heme iron utilization protein